MAKKVLVIEDRRENIVFIANNILTGNTASWLLDMPVPVGGGGIFATADDLDGRPHPTAVSAPVIRNNVLAANGGEPAAFGPHPVIGDAVKATGKRPPSERWNCVS